MRLRRQKAGTPREGAPAFCRLSILSRAWSERCRVQEMLGVGIARVLAAERSRILAAREHGIANVHERGIAVGLSSGLDMSASRYHLGDTC